MHRLRRRTFALSAAVAGMFFGRSASAQLAAFPGAQGFGEYTTGGRTGSVYVVTNLNDSGPGSFRDACSQSNRIIVFAVGGYINLQSAISASSNLTILGQTAPGQGIGIEGHELSFSDKSNEIIQYLRIREGSTDSSAKASLNLGDLNGGIVDHVSAEFSQYDNIDAVGANSAADNITYQNDLIADAIKAQQLNLHEEGNQTTYLNNLFANAHGRDPLAKSNDQYVDNVVYDYGYAYTTGNSSGHYKYDILNNYFIAGPSTTSAGDAWYQLDSNQSAFSSGNLLDSNKNGLLDGSPTSPGGLVALSSEWSTKTQFLPTLSASDAYAFDVAHAGDSLQYDQVDSQIINQVKSLGTQGSIYNTQTDDGLPNNGFGFITGGVAPVNTAGDGIADTWKITHGLNPNVKDSTLLNAIGYTMIEQYAQQLGDEYASQTWSNPGGDWTTGAWAGATPGIYDHALIRGGGAVNIGAGNAASAFSVSIGGSGGEALTVSGGSLTVQDTIFVGDQNNATLTQTGGVIRANNLQLGNTIWDTNGNPTTFTGTFNFNGGTLQVGQVVLGGGAPGNWTSGANWNWNGGTIQAFCNLYINAPATLGIGGALVNTTGPDGTVYSGLISGSLSGTGSFTKLGSGTLVLSAVNSYTGSTIVSAGVLIIAGPGALPSGSPVANNAIFIVNANSTSGPITGAGTLTVGIAGTATTLKLATGSGPGTQGAIVVNAGSTLDITNNSLRVNYGSPANDPVAAIAGYLATGYANGAWTGAGIDSSTAAGTSGALSVGYADGNTDNGTPVGPNQILVKYTLAGDANLDGLVNFSDLVAVIQNFNKAGADWAHGNFGYGASTNFADLVAVVQNFNKTPTPAGSSSDSLGGSTISLGGLASVHTDAVPEPAVIAMIAAGAAGLLARRRRGGR